MITWFRRFWHKIFGVKKPDAEFYFTMLYFGPRGACKSIHQAKQTIHIFAWLEQLYEKWPNLQQAIVLTNQKLNEAIERTYLGRRLYYWEDISDLRSCPRKNCWLGPQKHRLHNCYLFFDDIATILPADSWATTPIWLRKTFAQARHNGVRVIANCQDPFS